MELADRPGEPETGMSVAEEPEPGTLAAEEQDAGTEPVAGMLAEVPGTLLVSGMLPVEPGLSTWADFETALLDDKQV